MKPKQLTKIQIREIAKKHFSSPPNSIIYLGQGENNSNYILKIKENEYILRISMRGRDPISEHNFLHKIDHPSVPKSLIYDKSRTIIPYYYTIQEKKEGKHLKRFSKKRLIQHVQNLAKVHISTKQDVGSYDIIAFIKKEIAEWSIQNAENYTLFEEFILREALANKTYFQNINLSIINTDVLPPNMLFTKKNVNYIDWEWAQVSDPARDVAVFYYPGLSLSPWQINLSKERERLYLKTYQKYTKDSSLFKRVYIWQLIQAYMDLSYFSWKVNNWDKDIQSSLPKSVYETSKKKLYSFLRKQMRKAS